MQPYLRYFDKRELLDYMHPVCYYDYHMIFVIHGSFSAVVGNEEYILNSNDILIVPPATAFQVTGLSQKRTVYLTQFDIDRTHYYIPIMHAEPVEFFDKTQAIFPENPDELKLSHYTNCDFAGDILLKIQTEFQNNDAYSDEICGLLFHQLLLECKRTNNNKSPDVISQIIKYINNHYAEKISNKDISEAFGYHPSHLNRIFSERTGITIHKYLTECKLKEARRLLIHTNKSIAEISDAVGFEYPEYFTKVYKDYFSTTPTKTRKRKKF